MKLRIHISCLFLLITFFIGIENAKAENLISFPDTTCCTPPDSLMVVSADYPVFCVSWKAPSDSLCNAVLGFEIQWKLLDNIVWQTQAVTYTSGSIVNFCDSVDTCGKFQWRVRTKCKDSSFSDWVEGDKFEVACREDRVFANHVLRVTPNPTSESIELNFRTIRSGPVGIVILDLNGQVLFDRTTYVNNHYLREKISVSRWQRGIYFANVFANGILIARGKFVKE